MFGHKAAESSAEVRRRVEGARNAQRKRLSEIGVLTNSELTSSQIRRTARLERKAEARLFSLADRMRLGARAVVRVMRVARTVADLDGSEIVHENHVLEAAHFRERKG
jgi:magnesium chelatase family protein